MQDLLRENFPHVEELTQIQKDIIHSVLNKKNTIGIIRTGGGKSLTYQLTSKMLDGLTIVITPLVSLMEDQVEELSQSNIKALTLNSLTEDFQRTSHFNSIMNNQVDLLFVSPEKLLETSMIEHLVRNEVKISQLVIDEAHCLISWGDDFRQSYKKVFDLNLIYPKVPKLLLSGSLTQKMVNELKEKFLIDNEDIHKSSFNRRNIKYIVKEKEKKDYVDIEFTIKQEGIENKGIIYCNTVKETEKLSAYLTENGYKNGMYHSSLEASEKNQVQTDFKNDKLNLIVATTAFGMGVNVRNVKYVIHNSMPYSVDNYYQETGRAGRNGQECNTYVFYSKKEVYKVRNYMRRDKSSWDKFQEVYTILRSDNCIRKNILKHYGETLRADCKNCSACDKKHKKIDKYDPRVETLVQDLVSKTCANDRSVGTVVSILQGSGAKKIKDEFGNCEYYGYLKDRYKKNEIEELLYDMVLENKLDIEERIAPRYSWNVLVYKGNK